MNKTTTIARILADGSVVQVLPDGTTQALPQAAKAELGQLRRMTNEEITKAAMADPDTRPMTPEQLSTARRIPRVKTMRRALGLTQEEFATRYHIPLGTLRDWEQGRSEPDQPARAYLRVIAADPEAVLPRLEFDADSVTALKHTAFGDA